MGRAQGHAQGAGVRRGVRGHRAVTAERLLHLAGSGQDDVAGPGAPGGGQNPQSEGAGTLLRVRALPGLATAWDGGQIGAHGGRTGQPDRRDGEAPLPQRFRLEYGLSGRSPGRRFLRPSDQQRPLRQLWGPRPRLLEVGAEIPGRQHPQLLLCQGAGQAAPRRGVGLRHDAPYAGLREGAARPRIPGGAGGPLGGGAPAGERLPRYPGGHGHHLPEKAAARRGTGGRQLGGDGGGRSNRRLWPGPCLPGEQILRPKPPHGAGEA